MIQAISPEIVNHPNALKALAASMRKKSLRSSLKAVDKIIALGRAGVLYGKRHRDQSSIDSGMELQRIGQEGRGKLKQLFGPGGRA
jgi:hypothetical protein